MLTLNLGITIIACKHSQTKQDYIKNTDLANFNLDPKRLNFSKYDELERLYSSEKHTIFEQLVEQGFWFWIDPYNEINLDNYYSTYYNFAINDEIISPYEKWVTFGDYLKDQDTFTLSIIGDQKHIFGQKKFQVKMQPFNVDRFDYNPRVSSTLFGNYDHAIVQENFDKLIFYKNLSYKTLITGFSTNWEKIYSHFKEDFPSIDWFLRLNFHGMQEKIPDIPFKYGQDYLLIINDEVIKYDDLVTLYARNPSVGKTLITLEGAPNSQVFIGKFSFKKNIPDVRLSITHWVNETFELFLKSGDSFLWDSVYYAFQGAIYGIFAKFQFNQDHSFTELIYGFDYYYIIDNIAYKDPNIKMDELSLPSGQHTIKVVTGLNSTFIKGESNEFTFTLK
ncbi:hypothetical protein [Spiroplasma sp. DGKH1]|uniref:hypothetical protein n=1 Tax=Spiroplasma sp. DGKH1 TaxID=3050074 RepID=UPI0034C69337